MPQARPHRRPRGTDRNNHPLEERRGDYSIGDLATTTRFDAFAIIIPTKNEQADLPKLLTSIVAQDFPADRVHVVDNASEDRTLDIARSFGVDVTTYGPNQSAQRNFGARRSGAPAYVFLDADMELESGLLREIQERLEAGQECIAIPEDSIAVDLLGRARAFERSLHGDDLSIQAARVYSAALFTRIGGFDEAMTGGEDWLLSREAACHTTIARTTHTIHHHEGPLHLGELVRKYFKYGRGYYRLFRRGPSLFVEHANPLRKSIRKNLGSRLAASWPIIAVLVFYKCATYLAGGVGFIAEAVADVRSRGAASP